MSGEQGTVLEAIMRELRWLRESFLAWGSAVRPLRTDPTGRTAQPVTSPQLPNTLVDGRLAVDIGRTPIEVSGSVASTVSSTQLPATLGQKPMVASLPVVVSSDQSPVPVSGTVTATPSGTQTVNLGQVGAAAVALGQTTMAASVPVALASNQSPVPVSGTVTATPSGTQTVNLGQVGAAAVALGQTTMAGSIPVALASNQSPVPVSGTVTATPSGTQTVNLGQVGAAAVALGQRPMATSLPVVVASDQAALPVKGNSNAYVFINAAGAGVSQKDGAGVLRAIHVPAAWTGGKLDIYDSAGLPTGHIFSIDLSSPKEITCNIPFLVGLVTTTTGTPGSITLEFN